MFKCSICGKEYDTPVVRARCEIECDKTNQVKIEQERQNKLKYEKERRTEELEKAYEEYKNTCIEAGKKYNEIKRQYFKDYTFGTIPKYVSIDDFLDDLIKVYKF